MSRDSSLLVFPCELPIKVLGRNEAAFRDAALAIVRAHYGEEHRVAEQQSREGAYLSLTITVRAHDRNRRIAKCGLVTAEHLDR